MKEDILSRGNERTINMKRKPAEDVRIGQGTPQGTS
jgi:hypothetical protein